MERVLNQRVKGLPVSLYIIAFLLATIAWFASGDTTECALAASCQTTDTENFGAGAEFNQNRGSAADNDVIVHGDTVDEILDCDASADTCFFNGTVDASGATAVGFGNFVGVTVITSNTTYNVPADVSTLLVFSTGGGGGGGGFNSTTTPNYPGTAGAGAGTAVCRIDASSTPSFAVTIGAAGALGAANADGSAGGNTTFAALCQGNGGGGGFFAPGTGGIGGQCGTADFCIPGGNGFAFNATDATGLAAALGGGSWRGDAPFSRGSGGTGGIAGSTSGTNGIAGSVVIYEFS